MPLIITQEQVQYFSVLEKDFEVHMSSSSVCSVLFLLWKNSFGYRCLKLVEFGLSELHAGNKLGFL